MESPLQFAFVRRERKYPLPAGEWERVLAAAAARLPVERFDGAHERVDVRTIYLDTPALDSYREYCECRPVRTKLRIRQYGYEGRFGGECWVEIKIKRHGESFKRRFRCDGDTALALMAGEEVQERVLDLNRDGSDALDVYRAARRLILNRRLRPVARVDYERVSFQAPAALAGDTSSTGFSVRLTADRRIDFRSAGDSRSVRFDGVVLEVKHGGDEPCWLPELLAELGIRSSGRFSKYARAIEALRMPARVQRDSA